MPSLLTVIMDAIMEDRQAKLARVFDSDMMSIQLDGEIQNSFHKLKKKFWCKS